MKLQYLEVLLYAYFGNITIIQNSNSLNLPYFVIIGHPQLLITLWRSSIQVNKVSHDGVEIVMFPDPQTTDC